MGNLAYGRRDYSMADPPDDVSIFEKQGRGDIQSRKLDQMKLLQN